MKSLWDSAESERWNSNELEQRIYSARLLAKEPDLGCTFGGTVSVKTTEKDLFGEPAELIYVHATGTNLVRIEFAQFIPLRRDHLLRLLSLPGLSARGLELQIRLASNQPDSAEPTLDALLHAVIPAKYVDQVSADAILSLTNTPRAAELIQSVFGPNIPLIPYFQSNFDLSGCRSTRSPAHQETRRVSSGQARSMHFWRDSRGVVSANATFSECGGRENSKITQPSTRF